MSTNYAYTHKPWPVAGIKWTGHNFPEVEAFVRTYIGPDDETGVRNDPDEGWPTEKFAYNTVQFYACGDDQEVDPDGWIVVRTDLPADSRGRVWTLHDKQFLDEYVPAGEK